MLVQKQLINVMMVMNIIVLECAERYMIVVLMGIKKLMITSVLCKKSVVVIILQMQKVDVHIAM